MNLQQIDEVMRTEFWQEFIRRIQNRRGVISKNLESDTLEERAWLKHVKYQGIIEGLDYALHSPEEMIKQAKGTLGG